MKKLLPLVVCMIACTAQLWAQRYQEEVFSEVSVTSDVRYATNISVLTGQPVPQDLFVDIYQPVGDTVSERPLVLLTHTGNFLPPIINGGPYGFKTDSVNVEMCKRLARMGYVAASFQYRLGWNPLPTATDEVRRSTLLQAAYRGFQDARTCIRFFRKTHAEEENVYRIDTSRIALGGIGTGGYVALGAAFLDREDEIFLVKFLDLTDPGNPIPYVVPQVYGNFDGSDTTFLPPPNDNVIFNIGNHPDYSSDFDMVFNMGGALGDSSWIQGGEVPYVGFQTPNDPFAPYRVGNVIVPTTGDIVIPDAAGAYTVSRIINRFGNNQVFLDAGFTDEFTVAANEDNDGFEGLFPFIVPDAPEPQQCITSIPGAPASEGGPNSGPWNWYSEAWFAGAWDALGGQPGNPITGAEANCIQRIGFPNDPAEANMYIDSIMGYLAPRMVVALNADATTAIDNDLKASTNFRLYPNPTHNRFVVSVDAADNPIQGMELFDVAGRRVWNQQGLNTYRHQVELGATLKPGVYMLKTRLKTGSVTNKLLIQR